MFRVLLNDADGSIEWNEGFSARMTYAERISFPGALRWGQKRPLWQSVDHLRSFPINGHSRGKSAFRKVPIGELGEPIAGSALHRGTGAGRHERSSDQR
jgi:hypothetical protein